ncbi:hypothetical protein [Streptomyces hypolithicus]
MGQELRGGLTAFVSMAYIVVLKPLVLGSGADVTGAGVGAAPPARTPPAGPAGLCGQMLVHLGFQGGLHQVLGQLGQQPALTHQPQPLLSADLLGRESGQLLQQLAGRPFCDTGIDFTSAP